MMISSESSKVIGALKVILGSNITTEIQNLVALKYVAVFVEDDYPKQEVIFISGNIGVTVDDTYKACERFERLGVEFVKKPNDGKMKGIAFIKDPDGYWTEIFDLKTIGKDIFIVSMQVPVQACITSDLF
ncbi:hypothetical protein BDE02_04G184000 [Populus trichocarpa]|nr:hypothetical protein BDE02_04G184000 [Populus trichocarpa]